mmetsp:Transcript_19240/g.31281  ORF Transcript_19240/g.31281 Transcript_19240/m.31281 type:complete len:551 (+) Transcript_19240:106-1758(+)
MAGQFCFLILIVTIAFCGGSEFLKAAPKERLEHVSEADIQMSLLEEVEGTLGSGSATSRLRLLEATLKPMYDSLPKNEYGNLDHATVRYALHRLFVMRHGWSIKGLGRHVEAVNISSPAGVLKDQVPAYIQSTFEKRLGDKGLGLRELAVMASTLEHLIHKETVGKLGNVYNLFNILPTTTVSESTANEIFDVYMMAFILGESFGNLTLFDARALTAEMPELFLAWRETQEFVRRIRSNVTQMAEGSQEKLEFSQMAKVIEVLGEEYGSFQNFECHQLKDTLMKMEFAGSGRVKLADFYKPALGGGWQFQESVGYLRQLGALDESDPSSMSVIIVNYLHSQTNCIAASGYYSVCCIDECEGLLGHLEEKIAAPEAKPNTIVAMIEKMSSSTVNSSRKLSTRLLSHLDDIAASHGGVVPLHGRLFAQWLHHAYPRECPYPHMSGTTRQQTADEWLLESGIDSVATEEEMRQFTDQKETASLQDEEEFLPWSSEEELLVVRPKQNMRSSYSFATFRPLVLLALAGALSFGIIQTLQVGSGARCDTGTAKFIV